MGTNIITAMLNIADLSERPDLHKYKDLKKNESDKNRAKALGAPVEAYIKDVFAGTYSEDDVQSKVTKYNELFSYLGGSRNPPDLIIKGGDAIEVKKVESYSEVQLNSSSPKQVLKSDSDKINNKCKTCEEGWTEKDMIYIIVNKDSDSYDLESIWFVDARCYVAKEETYQKTFKLIKDSIKNISELSHKNTKELDRIDKIDALNNTILRVRPMWTLKHPEKLFDEFSKDDSRESLRVYAVISKEKFDTYSDELKEKLKNEKKIIKDYDKTIKDPDDVENDLEIVLLKLKID
ncbi:NgoPII family restriction endonuclease [Clostridium perfringens]|uniref:NgoPII family restriction endonuclease n=1 Tax=Clostridium perfringens TaxID=1502 RepID=UPI001120E5E4|nr:NgoPII family restriction endonuclease [Clostridium perfringens]MDM0947587.1 NgoPII family restriction endonuclease [Clostridium perfringens]TPE14357.1 NgoPII family restriction endonuclease [Clostridium perfringens]TPE14360.1 NgoPII family restriction endonuclease [Clostridium perfringens]